MAKKIISGQNKVDILLLILFWDRVKLTYGQITGKPPTIIHILFLCFCFLFPKPSATEVKNQSKCRALFWGAVKLMLSLLFFWRLKNKLKQELKIVMKDLIIVVICIKDLVYRLSHDCHFDIDRDVSTAHCRSSSGENFLIMF